MTRLCRIHLLGLALVTPLAGCRASSTTAVAPPAPSAAVAANLQVAGIEQLPPPVTEGSYSVPRFGSANAVSAAPTVAEQAAASCPVEPEPPKRGWRQWLPTTDHSNDPRRERGQTTDGWYEPEFRGMSD